MKNNILTKQYQINSIGRFTQLTYQTMPLINIMVQFLTIATAYGVWKTSILYRFSWLSLPIFVGIVIVCGLILMWLNHVFIYQGYYRHQNLQQFPEDGEVAKLIRKIVREELDRDKKTIIEKDSKGK
jgi:hypothetical protein